MLGGDETPFAGPLSILLCMERAAPKAVRWGCGIVSDVGSSPLSTSMANTILVVDDEKNIVQLARLYLGNEGFNVEEAYDGKQALDKARSTNPDLTSTRLSASKSVRTTTLRSHSIPASSSRASRPSCGGVRTP